VWGVVGERIWANAAAVVGDGDEEEEAEALRIAAQAGDLEEGVVLSIGEGHAWNR